MSDKGVYEILGAKVGRYDYKLAHVCEWIHSSVSGSGDGMQPEPALKLYFFLRSRLENWSESPPFTKAYDDGMKAICLAACEEYQARDLQADIECLLNKHGALGAVSAQD